MTSLKQHLSKSLVVWLVVECLMLATTTSGFCAGPERVTNVRIGSREDGAAALTFDIAWKDSWRHEGNHDALWVFFKVRRDATEDWQHLRLVADKPLNPKGYGQGGGTRVDLIVPDGDDGYLGLLVRRAEFGLGDVAAKDVTVIWNVSATKGVPQDLAVTIQAFAIDMIFVPEGAFELGSGGNEPGHFYEYTDGSQHTKPFRVKSADPIPTGQQAGKLWARRVNEPEDKGSLPATFPNGYRAFYCMKGHAMSEWESFVKAIPPTDAKIFEAAVNKHGGLSWADGIAFAAWAGLRPVTELEFEKITRGPMTSGWDFGDSLNHPSFWGVRSINGWRSPRDQVVTVANAVGRAFRGTHGMGTLVPPSDWPGARGDGAGIRGGHGAASNPGYRLDAGSVETERKPGIGWRGARTAPKGVGL